MAANANVHGTATAIEKKGLRSMDVNSVACVRPRAVVKSCCGWTVAEGDKKGPGRLAHEVHRIVRRRDGDFNEVCAALRRRGGDPW